MRIETITRVALLSATLYVSKLALEFLPNVELVSFLIIIFALVFGKETFLIITVFNLFQLVQWGFGIWWISYLYVWPLLCAAVLLLKKLIGEEFVVWAILSGVFGLVFGALFAVAYLPVDISYAVTYWVSGLPFDVWHGICNFLIMLAIGKPVYTACKKISALYRK